MSSDPLARIEKESERLNELIGQLLTITQLESQTGLMTNEQIDLAELLATIIEDANFESQAGNRRVSIDIDHKGSINGSHELLGRAFENVIRNALRHTAEESSVEVHLGLAEDGRSAEVTVRDHGINTANF